MIGLSCSAQKPPNMTDVHDPKTRSYNMSRIKGKDTKPEMVVRKFLFANGFRYRLHDKKLPGCRYFKMPQTNTAFWMQKIERNKEIDYSSKQDLIRLGYKVLIIWECELKPTNKNDFLDNLLKNI